MKKLLMCLMAFVSLALVGCSSDDDESPVVVAAEETNCISYNGKVCWKLVSAFEGGGIADPNEGTGTRLNIFAEAYSSYPSDKTAKVSIAGLNLRDKKYNGNGDNVETICLKDIPGYGDINVNLNQGVFEGGENAHVSSVAIHSLNYGKLDDKGNRLENANIHITIKMDNSAVIEIKFAGKVLCDEMC